MTVCGHFPEHERFFEIKSERKRRLFAEESSHLLFCMQLNIVDHQVAALPQHRVDVLEIDKRSWPAVTTVDEGKIQHGIGRPIFRSQSRQYPLRSVDMRFERYVRNPVISAKSADP